MTREEIITSMCYTWRHDFGLTKNEDPGGYTFPGASGMTVKDREHLWNQMAQIFDNDIAPNMKFNEESAVINPLEVPQFDPKDVRIGRLEKKVKKLQNQLLARKEKIEWMDKVLQYYPYSSRRYEDHMQQKAEREELKMLRLRVKEQELAIKQLTQEKTPS
jgi:hypothetical protein